MAERFQSGFELLQNLITNKFLKHNGIIECPLPQHVSLHFRTLCSVGTFQCINGVHGPRVARLFVYIDGGHAPLKDDICTWAVTFVGEDPSGVLQAVLASFGGKVPILPCDWGSMGQRPTPNSFLAELYAQAMARILIMQYAHLYMSCVDNDVIICFDSTSADKIAGRSAASRSQPEFSTLVQSLDILVKSVINLTTHHIYSHDMHPLNDYADSICTHMMDRRSPCLTPFERLNDIDRGNLDLFLAYRCSIIEDQITSSDADSSVQWSYVDPKRIAKCIDNPLGEDIVSSLPDISPSLLKFVQYNVLTLKLLEDQKSLHVLLQKNRVFACGTQEARKQQQGIFSKPLFLVCDTGAPGGIHGCQIIINCSIPIGKYYRVKYCVNREGVSILHTEPRLLAICVRAGPFTLALVSGHAPHHTNPDFGIGGSNFSSFCSLLIGSSTMSCAWWTLTRGSPLSIVMSTALGRYRPQNLPQRNPPMLRTLLYRQISRWSTHIGVYVTVNMLVIHTPLLRMMVVHGPQMTTF